MSHSKNLLLTPKESLQSMKSLKEMGVTADQYKTMVANAEGKQSQRKEVRITTEKPSQILEETQKVRNQETVAKALIRKKVLPFPFFSLYVFVKNPFSSGLTTLSLTRLVIIDWKGELLDTEMTGSRNERKILWKGIYVI